MIELLITDGGDLELTSDGDFVTNQTNTNFQDFICDIRCFLGSDVFDTGYGIPHQDLSQFGRIEATDKLIESYIRDKAGVYNVRIISFEVTSRQPFYSFEIVYNNDINEENQTTIFLFQ